MTHPVTKERFHQGAKVHIVSATAPRNSWVRNALFHARPQPMRDEARALAETNRHKSWARRWLKENGYWL